jgi:high-affinity iron transporter
MVDAVLLVLREVLEAALIMSLLLALSHKLQLRFRWSLSALLLGFMGSWILAQYTYEITDAMDGTGQELLNAVLYFSVVLSVVVLSVLILPLAFFPPLTTHRWTPDSPIGGRHHRLIYGLFIIIVSFSVAREGSEIWIYLSGFVHQTDVLSSVYIGAAIGTGIGMSLGAITYYAFAFMHKKYFLPVFLIVITLLAGGLSMQIAKQFMQIGLLNSTAPLWDSSFLVNEHSWLGELLYALLGYDARPAPIQGMFYLLTVAPILFACIWHRWRLRVNGHE